jgi:hypothetical protein
VFAILGALGCGDQSWGLRRVACVDAQVDVGCVAAALRRTVENVKIGHGNYDTIPILCQQSPCPSQIASVYAVTAPGIWEGAALGVCDDGRQRLVIGAQGLGESPPARRREVANRLAVVYEAVAACAKMPPLDQLGQLQTCVSGVQGCAKSSGP